ncbi:hypothetical protein PPERSA_08066 [Pseudocohnilembus persalinus]|uniref:Alkaline ceramidase n=1 Tax=Pseudocohnilembus persalinus TaxID=266149 RepID=A0A0V0R2L7_PSEPJ|nr:hypothetical protein PPERSA_08066 [Pseudocohnilembus persalinus]|eukprot:KRX08755.1 hypothetical protein PPERSA_08066 [Pseudocohnilembus persalinus]
MTYVLYKGWKESGRVLKDYSNISIKMPNNPKTLFNRGCTAYLVGFSFWIADQVFCNHLNNYKQDVGPVLQPFLEFHCYWHLFAGYGCYLFILTVQVIYSIKYKHDVEFREYCHVKGKIYSFEVCSLLTSWVPIVRPIDGTKQQDIENQTFVQLNTAKN